MCEREKEEEGYVIEKEELCREYYSVISFSKDFQWPLSWLPHK